jgi:hypothetical protein
VEPRRSLPCFQIVDVARVGGFRPELHLKVNRWVARVVSRRGRGIRVGTSPHEHCRAHTSDHECSGHRSATMSHRCRRYFWLNGSGMRQTMGCLAERPVADIRVVAPAGREDASVSPAHIGRAESRVPPSGSRHGTAPLRYRTFPTGGDRSRLGTASDRPGSDEPIARTDVPIVDGPDGPETVL